MVKKREMLADEETNQRAKAAMRLMSRKPKTHMDQSVYRLQSPDDKTLMFESRFECGNLYLA